ncbi:DNA polymerase [Aeromonas veronii]|uniref:DNA polymerase n=1 Tax=Aeromonas veronii TaxID=654 RepID=UPI00142FCF04|nr:DNA polymerase [Aeromonas veronii]NJI08848.1 hypothetical protein [Aeromonas veronii]
MSMMASVTSLQSKLFNNVVKPAAPLLNIILPAKGIQCPRSDSAVIRKYISVHQKNYSNGVEITPTIHPFFSGGDIAPQVEAQIVALHAMKDDQHLVHHQSDPFGCLTGRDVIRGPSLAGVKKVFWPYLLAPAQGNRYALVDYSSQEPAIAACFAGDKGLQAAYQQGDLYEQIGKHPRLASLGRGELKAAVLPYSYGQRSEAYAKEHDIPVTEAQRRWYALREIFHLVDAELNRRSQLAFRDGFVRCLDWGAHVTPLSNPRAVRNWPVQAAGADIMRRAVIGLYDAGIDLRLTIHDAFLIRVPVAETEQQVAKAIAVLRRASALVLGGFELNVKVDGLFDGQAGVM